MRRLTSTQVLCAGFAIILGLLVYSAFEAYRLQGAGGEQQDLAYRRFIKQDDAITVVRRTIWLGGIHARDYFLNENPAGREEFSSQIAELHRIGMQSMATLRDAAQAKLKVLEMESGLEEYFHELRRLESPRTKGIRTPTVFIEEVVIPRRLALLALSEDLRTTVRQELVDAQARHDRDRAVAARTLAFLIGAALFFGVVVALVSLRYAMRQDRDRQRHFEAISLANQELENLSSRVLEIQEQERRALSQELHDEVGQTLTALRMELSHAISLVVDSSARERLLRARQLAELTVRMVRDISLMLRPSILDDLGLGPALQWQMERFSKRSGIRYVFKGDEVGEHLSDEVKTCVFRIAQETLNNCEKYSNASTLFAILRHEAGQVSLEVQDDGLGFTLDQRGLPSRGTGILGMKERAQKLGGSLTVNSRAGGGTRIVLNLPTEESLPVELATGKERA